MSLICNVRTQIDPGQGATADEPSLYLDNERYIEAGSAYFGQAHAEAMGLVSDIELHNFEGAGLRLRSIASLLEYALRQYDDAVEFGSRSGLTKHHQRKLREAGLDYEGVRRVLGEALSRGFLADDDERIEMVAATFDQRGYSGLMGLYIGRVREIHTFTLSMSGSEKPEGDAVVWQELAWKLSTFFSQTLEVGKAIAILNIFTFRIPSTVLGSVANRSESLELNA
jgi:hypothetical protein